MRSWRPRQDINSASKIKGLICPTFRESLIGNIGEFSGLPNPISGRSEKENPGALAGATGVKDVVEGVCTDTEHTPAYPILARHWGTLQ